MAKTDETLREFLARKLSEGWTVLAILEAFESVIFSSELKDSKEIRGALIDCQLAICKISVGKR